MLIVYLSHHRVRRRRRGPRDVNRKLCAGTLSCIKLAAYLEREWRNSFAMHLREKMVSVFRPRHSFTHVARHNGDKQERQTVKVVNSAARRQLLPVGHIATYKKQQENKAISILKSVWKIESTMRK